MGATTGSGGRHYSYVSGHCSAGLDSKKKRVTAAEQDPESREQWREETAGLPSEELVFVDETNTTIAMTRRFARAPQGERAYGSVPRNHGRSTTLVAALSCEGLGAAMTLQGAMDREGFIVYVRDLLCPSLRAGQIVVMDNLSVHQGEVIRALIESAHCHLLFLPSYSPDFSPIELAYSKIKESLRAAAARTQEALDSAITDALQKVTEHDALGWFRHCSYPACQT